MVFTFHQGERAWLQCCNISGILQLIITRLQQKQNKMNHRYALITGFRRSRKHASRLARAKIGFGWSTIGVDQAMVSFEKPK